MEFPWLAACKCYLQRMDENNQARFKGFPPKGLEILRTISEPSDPFTVWDNGA